jgi:hypothetical protein
MRLRGYIIGERCALFASCSFRREKTAPVLVDFPGVLLDLV